MWKSCKKMLIKFSLEGNYSISIQLWNENENELQTVDNILEREEIESQLQN